MNASLIVLELAVVILGLVVLVQDLFTPAKDRRTLGYGAVLGVAVVLLYSFFAFDSRETFYAFGNAYVLDGLALWFKRFFLLAALLVLVMATEFSDRFEAGQSEFFALTLFALAGMMFAASANDFRGALTGCGPAGPCPCLRFARSERVRGPVPPGGSPLPGA